MTFLGALMRVEPVAYCRSANSACGRLGLFPGHSSTSGGARLRRSGPTMIGGSSVACKLSPRRLMALHSAHSGQEEWGRVPIEIPGRRIGLHRSDVQDAGSSRLRTFAHHHAGIAIADRGMSISRGGITATRNHRRLSLALRLPDDVAWTASFERGGWTALAVNRRFVSCRPSWRARRRRPTPSPGSVHPLSASSPTRSS